ncbi:MAG: hypothetical protein H7A33_05810 [Deltaproteobacteria bacterium]|nr:hypothetical protein [Deltaproteobacteria bacterium]
MTTLFIKKAISNILIITFFWASLPVKSAFAKTSKRLALVEVQPDTKSPHANLRYKILTYLGKKKDFELVPEDQLAAAFLENRLNRELMTQGDLLLHEAEDLFSAFKVNKAQEFAVMAIEELKNHPGILGSLQKAYLLQTQISWELNQDKAANQALRKAVQINLSAETLDGASISPKLKKEYEKMRNAYLNQIAAKKMTIQLKDNSVQPIYVNGMFRGIGPRVEIMVDPSQVQFIQAGTNIKQQIESTDKREIVINASNAKKNNALGFDLIKPHELVQRAQIIGRQVGADWVALLNTPKNRGEHESTLQVINVADGTVSKEISEMLIKKKQSEELFANKVSSFVSSLNASDFNQLQNTVQTATNTTGKTIKKKSKAGIYVGIGLAVVAAGAAAAFALGGGGGGGGSSSSGPSTVSTSLSGPVPSGPSN